jgi:hypothetical protein
MGMLAKPPATKNNKKKQQASTGGCCGCFGFGKRSLPVPIDNGPDVTDR